LEKKRRGSKHRPSGSQQYDSKANEEEQSQGEQTNHPAEGELKDSQDSEPNNSPSDPSSSNRPASFDNYAGDNNRKQNSYQPHTYGAIGEGNSPPGGDYALVPLDNVVDESMEPEEWTPLVPKEQRCCSCLII